MLVKYFKYIILGFLSGVTVHSLYSPGGELYTYTLFIFILGSLLILISWFWWREHTIAVGIFLVGVGFGLLRFSASIDAYRSSVLDMFVQKEVSIELRGVINSDPLWRGSFYQMVVDVDTLVGDQDALPVNTQVLIKTSSYNDYLFGQYVSVEGVLQKPEAFDTDTGRVFDYREYLAKDDIYYTMSFAQADILRQSQKSLRGSLYGLKHQLLDGIYRYIPRPESGLLAGILVGQESALDEDTEDAFRRVGLMHIVVLSGYNVALVIFALMALLKWIPVYIRSVCVVCGIVMFALLVGAGPTVIRASIMAMFIVLGRVLHMRYDVTRALLVAGVIMILINPRILIFDISFQLSFLASYGLIVFSPFLEKRLQWLPAALVIRESAITTLSAQLFVLPLLLYSIGEFSIVSPVVNILVLFAVPISMLLGFSVGVLSFLIPVVSQVIAIPATWTLSYQLWIVDIFARLPFATVTVPRFHWMIMVILYILLFWWVRRFQKGSQDKKI